MDSVHHREAQYITLDADCIIGCTEEHLDTTSQLGVTSRNLFDTTRDEDTTRYTDILVNEMKVAPPHSQRPLRLSPMLIGVFFTACSSGYLHCLWLSLQVVSVLAVQGYA
ncbi:uncharacterized protein ARMOST_17599 [Armillaria ostoyae]|uniref:Uncharacterized protein n=1 Tax=Armillaria ostoyae TaxID=47428 RepID=A0A284RZF0_ARMOS|nr:uncharacterized protein ARMOST_17599 [Armillaria ostoyae]